MGPHFRINLSIPYPICSALVLKTSLTIVRVRKAVGANWLPYLLLTNPFYTHFSPTKKSLDMYIDLKEVEQNLRHQG